MQSFLLIAFIPALVLGHSWVECTDYRINNENDLVVWNPANCFGRIRKSERQNQASFGDDLGLNHQGKTCQGEYVPNEPGVPRASYTPGQKVCLAYPAKNHASSSDNPYIPDSGVTIRRSKVGEMASNKFDGRTYEHLNGVHVNGQVDLKGFQNCPAFVKGGNKDRALCTLCFELESDIAPGEYAFSWEWRFNSENDVYTSCWDATVGTGGNPPSPALRSSNSNSKGLPADKSLTLMPESAIQPTEAKRNSC